MGVVTASEIELQYVIDFQPTRDPGTEFGNGPGKGLAKCTTQPFGYTPSQTTRVPYRRPPHGDAGFIKAPFHPQTLYFRTNNNHPFPGVFSILTASRNKPTEPSINTPLLVPFLALHLYPLPAPVTLRRCQSRNRAKPGVNHEVSAEIGTVGPATKRLPGIWPDRHTESIPVPNLDVQDTPAERYWLVQRLSAFCRSLKSAERYPGSDIGDNQWNGVSADKVPRLVSRVDDFLQARIKTHASASLLSSPPSLSSSLTNISTDDDAFEHRRLAALSSLNEALQTADPVAFLGIAVFAFFEVVSDGVFGQWQRHLRGARSLLDYHCRSREELDVLSNRVTGLAEMVAFFSWWDTTGTVVRKLSGGHAGEDDRLIFLDWHRDVMDEDFFNTMQRYLEMCSSNSGLDLERFEQGF
ncbi:hypothetical protein FZEAL_9066 [Fusarium zealandicum]|uniref:Transcription factor n=1 Tax=Fusarium zealandicum TaxID=1053134 RepID=A0A8H4UD47_9HYPO|nr:hypothetical protein FZEAL_9066 [Fusarium zealandicum]